MRCAQTSVPAAKTPSAAFGASVNLRDATPADVLALVALINEAYLFEDWLLPGPRTDASRLRKLLDEGRRLVIAEIDGAIAGTVSLEIGDGYAYFEMLAVKVTLQGNGLATLLLARIEQIAREHGAAEMRLDCIGELNLPAYYETLGYEVTETVAGHRYGSRKSPRTDDRPVTRVDMVKRL